jgi:hypothetical protein
MPKIFISYRRDDAAGFAGRLADALEARYGMGTVFRDVDDIEPGKDFVEALDTALRNTDVFIVMIGRQWLSVGGPAAPRLHDPMDYVRREIAMALERDIPVIPALLEGARMPSQAQLPPELADLARRQAIVLDDRSWNADVQKLMSAIETNPVHGTSAHAKDVPVVDVKRRGLLWIGLPGALALAVFGGWRMSRVPDLAGEWRLEDGSRWRVRQEGRNLEIEDVHYQSREVWREGTGRITREGVVVDLRYVFETRASLHGTLRLSEDERTLSGIVTQTPSAQKLSLDVRR